MTVGVGEPVKLGLTADVIAPAGSWLPVTVHLQDASGNDVTSPNNIALRLGNDSETTQFSASADGSNAAAALHATLPAGAATIIVYVRDTTARQAVLTATDTSLPVYGNYTEGTLTLDILAGAPAGLAFMPVSSPTRIHESHAVQVFARDIYGNSTLVEDDTAVALTSTSSVGVFGSTDSGPWQSDGPVVILAGTSTVQIYYRDGVVGRPTLTAASEVLGTATSSIDMIAGPYAGTLQFSVAPIQIIAGEDQQFGVSLFDNFGNQTTATSAVSLSLASSNSTGEFSADGVVWSSGLTLSISVDQSSTTFRYRDSTSGTVTMTVRDDTYPLGGVSHQLAVKAATPAAYSFISAPQIIAKDTASGAIAIGLQDRFGNDTIAEAGFNATIATSTSTGKFSADGSSGWASNSSSVYFGEGSGQEMVYYRDSTVGVGQLIISGGGFTQSTQNIQIVEGIVGQIAIHASPDVQAGAAAPVTIETQTTDGLPAAVLTDTTVVLLAVGQFSLTETPWNPITSIEFMAGQSQISLYYRNTQAGIDTLTASESPSRGWTDGSALMTVGAHDYYQLAYNAAPNQVAVTESSDPFVVSARDVYGNVKVLDQDTDLYVYSSAASGTFAESKAGPWTSTTTKIIAGASAATFYYQDTALGSATVTVSDRSPLDSPDTDILNAVAQIDIVGQTIARLRFTNAARSIEASQMSSVITLQLQKADGSPAIQDTDTMIPVGEINSMGYVSYRATNDVGGAPISSVTVLRGESSVSFYATSTVAGTHHMYAGLIVPGLGMFDHSQPLSVSPAAPHALAFTSAPQAVHAGADSAQFRVSIQDEFGNATPTASDIVLGLASSCAEGQFSLNAGQNWAPVSSVAIMASETTAHFYYKDTVPDRTCSLVASSVGLAQANQNVDITQAAAAQLSFSVAPATAVAGASATFTVSARDMYGNVVSVDYETTVYVSTSSSTGQLSASNIKIPAGQSNAQFTYTDPTPGTYQLKIADQPGAADVNLVDVSHAITITLGDATALSITPGVFSEAAGSLREVTITLLNEHDAPLLAPSAVTVDVSSTAGSGDFRTTNTMNAPVVSQIVIPSGASSVKVYYAQALVGAATITAQDHSGVLAAGTAEASIYPNSLTGMVFITSPQTLEAGQPSAAMTVQAVDAYGNATNFAPTPLTVYLHSSSAGGKFFSDAAMTVQVDTLRIETETSTATFYYRDTSTGTPTIAVSDRLPPDSPDAGLSNAHQTVTVAAGAPVALRLPTEISGLERGGVTGPVAVALENAYGVKTSTSTDQPVYLSSSSPTAEFASSPAGPWSSSGQVTVQAGASSAEFYYRDDTTLGVSTIMVSDVSAPPEVPDTGLTNDASGVTVVTGAVTQLAFISSPQTVTARHPSAAMTVQARNHYGIETVFAHDTNVYLRSTSAAGEFSSSSVGPWGVSYISVNAGNATASFYYRDGKNGTPTLTTGVGSATSSISASQQQTIELQVLSHFLVTNVSDPHQQGSPSSVVVAAVDSENYVIDWYSGKISFSASDHDAVVPADYTFDPAKDKGIHTFTNGVAFRSAGEKVITVSSGGVSGEQMDITVTGSTAGPVSKLVFTTPTPPLSIPKHRTSEVITVQLQDASGAPSNAGPSGYPVRLQSSSSSGEFASAPDGPWQSSLVATVPAGLNYVNFYYRDSAAGEPTITAADWLSAVDSPAITNATLLANIQAIAVDGSVKVYAEDVTGNFVSNPFVFAHTDVGDAKGRVVFELRSREERNNQPRLVDWQLRWRNGSGALLAQNAHENLVTLHYQPADFAARSGDGPFTLNVAVADKATDESASNAISVPVSPWRVASITPALSAQGDSVSMELQSYNNDIPTDAPQQSFSVFGVDSNQAIQVPLPAQRSSIGTWQTGISTAQLQPETTYVMVSRLLDAAGNTLAEDRSEPFSVPRTAPSPITDEGNAQIPGASIVDEASPSAHDKPSQSGAPNQNTDISRPNPAAPADNSWLQSIGRFMKRIFSAHATPVIVSRSLFGILLLIALALLWQAYKELRHARAIALILKREEQTTLDKNNFMQLSAHYLRTPITIINASVEMLSSTLSAAHQQYIESLQTVAQSLQAKVEHLLSQTHDSLGTQATLSEKDLQAQKRQLYKTPLFWLPVILSVFFIILINWLAITVGERSINFMTFLEQFIFMIAGAVLLYLGIRTYKMRRQRRQLLDDAMLRQAAFDRVKNQFIIDTYTVLSGDVVTLSQVQRALPPGEKSIAMLAKGTQSLQELINKLELLSTIHTASLQPVQSSTNSLISTSLTELSSDIEAKQVKVIRQGDSTQVYQDIRLLGQVVSSVLENATEYSHQSGAIEISTSTDDQAVELRIRDHGPGFSRDPQQLFEPFARDGDVGQFDHEGIGLGLSLDRLIMRHLGGSIAAANQAKDGAEVTLSFPRSLGISSLPTGGPLA